MDFESILRELDFTIKGLDARIERTRDDLDRLMKNKSECEEAREKYIQLQQIYEFMHINGLTLEDIKSKFNKKE